MKLFKRKSLTDRHQKVLLELNTLQEITNICTSLSDQQMNKLHKLKIKSEELKLKIKDSTTTKIIKMNIRIAK